jgi:hypothetical protein
MKSLAVKPTIVGKVDLQQVNNNNNNDNNEDAKKSNAAAECLYM